MSDPMINCPECGAAFALTDSLTQHLRAEMEQTFAGKRVEIEARAAERAVSEQKARADAALAEAVAAAEDKDRALAEARQEAEAQKAALTEARAAQAEAEKLKRALADREAALEVTLQRRLSEEVAKEREVASRQIAERVEAETAGKLESYELKLAERDEREKTLKRQIEALRQKSQQGSMQVQGEAAETLLEERLDRAFPADAIEAVGKGVRGADCLQRVARSGTILWESKRTRAWSNDWLPKLRDDMRAAGADVAAVSEARPDGVETSAARRCLGVRAAFRKSRWRIDELRKVGARRRGRGAREAQAKDRDAVRLRPAVSSAAGWRCGGRAVRGDAGRLAKEKNRRARNGPIREKRLDKARRNDGHVRRCPRHRAGPPGAGDRGAGGSGGDRRVSGPRSGRAPPLATPS